METPRLDTANKAVRILIDTLYAHGIRHVVCSPGSRNTPLIIAADCREKMKKYIVVDERTAGFIALGLAKSAAAPVALICTSGTALLNYGPALAEAYHSGYPLIVISADRPAEWIDQDDSQTMLQPGVYHNYIKASYDIPSGREDEEFEWWVNRIANEGFGIAMSGKRGPVHFNVHLGNELQKTLPYQYHRPRKIYFENSLPMLRKERFRELAEIASKKKILITVGYAQSHNSLSQAFKILASLPNVTIMAETVSNLHIDPKYNMIDSLLSTLSEDEKEALRPDIVISTGGALVSRHLKTYLRNIHPKEHWDISTNPIVADCFQSLTMKVNCVPSAFFYHLAASMRYIMRHNISEHSDYALQWDKYRCRARVVHSKYLRTIGWSEMKAFQNIIPQIPEKANLFLSNGTSIRYHQLFEHPLPHTIFCNRGVSGIEGCTSTAIGTALRYKQGVTVLITGDMSATYDIGAFASRLAPPSMRIIVINNAGGGIFRFIRSTSKLEQREEYFCADPKLPVKEVAEAYDWEYFCADSEESLSTILPHFFDLKEDGKPQILEIITPPGESAEILRNYFA